MRNITHITLRRQSSAHQPQTARRCLAAAFTCAAMLTCLPVDAALGAESPGVGRCRLVLRVTVAPTRRDHRVVSAYGSSSGTSSCTGSLGPWLMGGKTGWSASEGTFENVITKIVNQKPRVSASGTGSFWAAAPRSAWFHPPMVAFTGAFHFHETADVINLNGTGRLIPTREAPVAASFSFAGTATLTLDHDRAHSASRTTGTLTIQFVARNRAASSAPADRAALLFAREGTARTLQRWLSQAHG